ncbi:hypothetical protein [Seohaeicola zhoushanensis]|uniref:Uncharacterized protein n=1 Tax=Seohaeicola zhoushanensis TaxID=1569283 RepID=A0A8J3GTY8_9RHOB|nr:hypothetical protein [Seohaeicola zhoushanensis]GHF33458.1 hypothetical protein GCM10017056_01090 [Seohaeicola zhoushanensis]
MIAVIGLVILGTFAGMAAGLVALLAGQGIWLSLLAHSLAGAVTIILLAGVAHCARRQAPDQPRMSVPPQPVADPHR